MKILQFLPDVLRERRLSTLVKPHTLVGRERIRNLYRLARQIEIEKIPGDVVECGVYHGGTAAILGHFATNSQMNRTLWLFDSFQGMPATTEADSKGVDGVSADTYVSDLVGDIERVRTVLSSVGTNMARVRIVPGWFQDTFPTLPAFRIAVLNIDADWYESVKLCLETFFDRVEPGGFVSIDDYGHWPGCKKAVEEFFERRGFHPKLQHTDYSARWFQKPQTIPLKGDS